MHPVAALWAPACCTSLVAQGGDRENNLAGEIITKAAFHARVPPVDGARPRQRGDARHLVMPAKALCCSLRVRLPSIRRRRLPPLEDSCSSWLQRPRWTWWNFEVVEGDLPVSARSDGGRARSGAGSRSAAAAFKPASVSACTYASAASIQTACASLRT